MQSKCFKAVYSSQDNFVLSSPTGSGKTAIFELAICRLASNNDDGYKVVYQAPTKSLCSERFQDWRTKFDPLGLTCAEVTGDTEQTQLNELRNARIIITTPEKWDSMTRRWKDYERLIRLVKLFLIDEVHMLGDDRGATLEAVISRMKSVSAGVRFIALSATIPNAADIAEWLGKSPDERSEPARLECFGEEFRPVPIRKYVHGYKWNTSNNFAFERMLDEK